MSDERKSFQDSAASPFQTLPVLPLRDVVVFPHMIIPLFVGRGRSISALESAMEDESSILLVTQHDAREDEPTTASIYSVGVLAHILQLLKLPDGTVKILVEGVQRVQIQNFVEKKAFLTANVRPIEEEMGADTLETEAIMRSLLSEFEAYVKLNKKLSPEIVTVVSQIKDPSKLADAVAAHLVIKLNHRQEILETSHVAKRLEKILGFLESEISILQVEKKIRTRVKRQMEQTQREYYLNEQMKAIQKELGDTEGGGELAQLAEAIREAKLSKEALDKAQHELKKLRQMPPLSTEATVVRNYLDWLISLPWGKKTRMKQDLSQAQAILDEDHFGLEKVKERILEYLAVQKRVNKLKGPILCLVGPPGVGKTSLGKSIAKATGREFVRLSLGGVMDEAEVRGHRRTYIGAMPGKILQSMKKAKTSNPLFLLDEIDKMGVNFRGDPASALLEVLDPEQNTSFNDHYLEVDYDLSHVMFVTTANTLDILPALLDRMEVIRIPGYTEEEKYQIARKHLIPDLMKKHGIEEKEWSIHDNAVWLLIQRYTREAGVRSLERELATLLRKAAKQLVLKECSLIQVTKENLETYLGIPKYTHQEAELEDPVGVSTGLAWTEVGGELLTIEAVVISGRGKMIVTGNLKDVMKESISAASSYVRSRCLEFGIPFSIFEKKDVHVHVPEAATPKDGPSAGIAMVTAIISAMTGIPTRKDIAMTGEVTLRGRVLQIGGLKEKVLAALRGGIRTVLIPHGNTKDLSEIPENVRNQIEIVPVSHMDEVLQRVLLYAPTPILKGILPRALEVESDILRTEEDSASIISH